MGKNYLNGICDCNLAVVIRVWLFFNVPGRNHCKGAAAEKLGAPCGRQRCAAGKLPIRVDHGFGERGTMPIDGSSDLKLPESCRSAARHTLTFPPAVRAPRSSNNCRTTVEKLIRQARFDQQRHDLVAEHWPKLAQIGKAWPSSRNTGQVVPRLSNMWTTVVPIRQMLANIWPNLLAKTGQA